MKVIAKTDGPKYNGSGFGCLTIGKEYSVIKYYNDELSRSERVVILNDNNIEKSYDPKLFKGIE